MCPTNDKITLSSLSENPLDTLEGTAPLHPTLCFCVVGHFSISYKVGGTSWTHKGQEDGHDQTWGESGSLGFAEPSWDLLSNLREWFLNTEDDKPCQKAEESNGPPTCRSQCKSL